MITVYLVYPQTAINAWRVFAQSDVGPMGFEHDADLWCSMIEGCWIYRAQTKVFEAPVLDRRKQLARLRDEMRPRALAVLQPAPFLLQQFEDLHAFAKQKKRAEVYARRGLQLSKKNDAPWIVETVADCAVALDMLAPHASLIQIWQNSDRGAGALLNGIGIEEFTNSMTSRHNASLVIVSDILEVPTW
jgi:hypothetical protein